MLRDYHLKFIPFGILARATFLISLCIIAITHGFGVPQQPQLPPTLDQQAQPPDIPVPNAEFPLPTQPQPSPTTDPPHPQTTALLPDHSSLSVSAGPPLTSSISQVQTTGPSATNLQAPQPLDLHPVLIPPASRLPPSDPMQLNLTESKPQPSVTSEPLELLLPLNGSLEDRPKLESPHTAAPFLLVKETLQESQTVETKRMVEPEIIRVNTSPPQPDTPLVIARPTNISAIQSNNSQPEPAINTTSPEGLRLEMRPTVTEPAKILISEKPIRVAPERTTPPTPLFIELFMGTLPVDCGDDPLTSCEGRCVIGLGSSLRSAQLEERGAPSMEEKLINGTRYTCNCDLDCVLYGDCCTDYFSLCLDIRTDEEITDDIMFIREIVVAPLIPQEEDLPGLYWATDMYMVYGSCEETSLIYEDVQETHRFWMISRCPESYTDPYGGDVIHNCEVGPKNSLYSYPVSKRWFAAPIYKNIFCALCHQIPIETLLFWPEVFYCSKKRAGEDDSDVSFQDVVDAADISGDCPMKSGARPPSNVLLRFCSSHDISNSSKYFEDPYISGCQLDIPGLDLAKKSAITAACQSIFQPVWVPEVPATFSSVHCALCSGIPESVLRMPTCQTVSSPPARLQTETVFAEIGYDEGLVTVRVNGSQIVRGFICADDVLQDHASVFLEKCPQTTCPTDLQFSDRLTQMEMSCLISRLQYTGRYWENWVYFPPRDQMGNLILTITKPVWYLHRALTEELNLIYDGFSYALAKQCGDECSQQELELIFQSVSLNNLGDFRAEFLHRGRLSEIFPVLSFVDRYVGLLMFMPTTVTNYQQIEDVCPNDPTLALEMFDIPLVVQSYKIYTYVDLWGRGCFFDLEQIGFSIEFDSTIGPPKTVLSIVLCWVESMATRCNIPRPNVTSEVKVAVAAPPSGDPDPQGGILTLTSLPNENKTLNPSDPLTNRSHSARLDNKNEIIREETKVFKIACFTLCAVASLISAIHNLILLRGSGNLHTLLFLSVSKISLAVCMALYVININKADVDSKLMAIFMHCGWILGSISLAVSFKGFQFSSSKEKDVDEPQTNTANNKVLKWLVFTLIVCVVVVGLSVAVGEDSESDENVGYSSNSGHLFWMTNENGCYMSTVAVIGVCYLVIFTKLGFESMKPKRSRLDSRSSDGCIRASGSERNSKELTSYGRPKSSTLVVYLVHMISMFLVAIADYVDKNNTLWKLLFCVASASAGLHLLASLWKELFNTVCCSVGLPDGNESISSDNRYSSSSDNLDGTSQSHVGGQVYKVENDFTASANIDNNTSVIYAPE